MQNERKHNHAKRFGKYIKIYIKINGVVAN